MAYTDDYPADLFHPRPQHLPPGTGTFGMVLFLISLGMLFAASMVGYLLIRFLGPQHTALHTISLPWPLWISTVVILISSVTVHRALRSVRLERQKSFRIAIGATWLLGLLFLFVQAPSLATLLEEHWAHQSAQGHIYLYALVFVLIALHAVHVIGGLIFLTVVTFYAFRGAYDHERYHPVKYVAMYWHFLDAVWVIMFTVLLVSV